MNKRRWDRRTERDKYVSREEFVGVFASEQQGLQRLTFLLTANAEAVAQCLSLALQECLATNLVFKGRARRMVIRNAISLVMSPGDHSFVNTNRDADDAPAPFSSDAARNGLAASKSIVDLPDFERFVFVICILERYSIHDCALLLRKSPRDINETRQRIDDQVGNMDELSNT